MVFISSTSLNTLYSIQNILVNNFYSNFNIFYQKQPFVISDIINLKILQLVDEFMDQFNLELGNNIKSFRKSIFMSTTTLAELSSTSQGTISKIENGHSTSDIKTLIRICKALGVTIYDVLPEDISKEFKTDNPNKEQLFNILNDLSPSEIKVILALLTTDIVPILSNLSPVIKAFEQMSIKERNLFTDLLESMKNNS
ncbi:transcriptional regulator [Priestia megaterium]|jgi:transcriptional regulator with XRE-family HTH domain|nr:transcriptional regulator [Priestia megaterium]